MTAADEPDGPLSSRFVERLTVEGETWDVHEEDYGHGPQLTYTWVSHPVGYGFAVTVSDGSVQSRDEQTRSIRDFLADIDPETGYLEE